MDFTSSRDYLSLDFFWQPLVALRTAPSACILRMGEARPGFVFSLAVPCSDTTAKRAFQVSQSPAGQRLFEIGRSQQPGLWLSPLFMGCWVLQQKLGQRIPPLLEASIRLR